MELREFLSLVTPSEGVRFVTLIKQKKDRAQKHAGTTNVPFHTTDEGAQLVEGASVATGHNVYFSCASFEHGSYVDDKGKSKSRTGDNAIYARAIWRDLDVGLNDDGDPKPNAYDTQEQAVDAVVSLCKALSLPLPLLVSSGKGVHAYWPFNRDVSKAEWLRLASMAQKVFPRFGLKGDPSRDRDIASVLRPVGGINRGKYLDSAVTLVEYIAGPGKRIDPDDFSAILSPHAPADAVELTDDVPEFMRGAQGAATALAAQREYPPSYAEIIATKCAQIDSFKKTGGTSYRTWWMGVGLCKHTVEGEDKAHEWAAKHADYDRASTQTKLDGWEKGPPTCESYGDESGLCATCEFKDKVRSPIMLGYAEETKPQEIVVFDDEKEEPHDVVLPEGYVYFNDCVSKRVVVDGQVGFAKITKTLFWFTGRSWLTSGEMVYTVVSQVRKRKDNTWQLRTFDLLSGTIGKGGTELYGALGQNEIYAVSEKGAKARMDSLVSALAEQLKQKQEETRAYKVYGWQEDGGFLLGEDRIHGNSVTRVRMAGDSAPSFLPAFAKNGGNPDVWCELVESMYARPRHAAFQTVVLFGIGSPLLKYYHMPTGCLINMVGEKGTGKTTAARVGLSAYGDPDGLMTELRSTTELALYNRLATMHSVPINVDELTNVEPLKASNMIYSIMNGQPRDGMRSDGKRRDQLLPWQTVTFGSANGSVIDLLASFKGNASAEISRLIEIDWPGKTAVDTLERREMDELLDQLRGHYGSIGRAFVQWICSNERKAERTLLKMREFIEDELKIDKENRYWSAHIAVPLATKMILQEMGLLDKFALDDALGLCLSTIREHQTSIVDMTMNNMQAFHSMLTFLSDKIITTRMLKDGRLSTLDAVIMNGEPVGRAILESNDLYLSVSAVREWCSLKRMSYKAMRKELVEMEILLGDARFYFGRGTTRLTGQTYCWHLNLSRVLGVSSTKADVTEAGHLRLVRPLT